MNKVVWLTGQSGAGKTTIAKKIQEEVQCIILDGDEMRESVSLGTGFSREARTEHNYRVARLAKVLSRQHLVIVSVIAPIDEVRKKIDEICQPEWIYLKRDMPEREGHFYEEPEGFFTVDNDKHTVEESAKIVREHIGFKFTGAYSLFIGRYQPLHEGHVKLIRSVLDEGRKVCIALRETEQTASDPYSINQRLVMFDKEFEQEIDDGRVVILEVPDIAEVCYGRKVGWGMRRIRLPEEVEAISATKIREGTIVSTLGEKTAG